MSSCESIKLIRPHGSRRLLTLIVLAFVLSVPSVSSQIRGSSNVEVVRVDGGYQLRYLDPDFDNKPMQLFVRDATSLKANIVATVRREGPSLWRYDYEIVNVDGSDQQLAWWSMQVQTGSRIVSSPVGWDSSIQSDDLPLFTASAATGYEVVPGLRATGWSILSDSLPVIKEANLRGLPRLDIGNADLPSHVRRFLAEMETRNSVRVNVIVPWIPTRQIAIGHEGPIDPRATLRQAIDVYSRPLLVLTSPEDAKRVERVARVMKRLEDVQASLGNKDRVAALRILRDAEQSLESSTGSDQWSREVHSALKLIVQYIIDQVR